MNVNQRLRRVDARVANIDRRLGFLSGRAFFKPYAPDPEGLPYDWLEIDITDFADQGISPKNLRTGHEVEAHRFSVTVSRDWFERYADMPGRYAVQVSEGAELLHCEPENISIDDGATTGTLSLRVTQEVRYA